jgi:hypothetical protein
MSLAGSAIAGGAANAIQANAIPVATVRGLIICILALQLPFIRVQRARAHIQ